MHRRNGVALVWSVRGVRISAQILRVENHACVCAVVGFVCCTERTPQQKTATTDDATVFPVFEQIVAFNYKEVGIICLGA